MIDPCQISAGVARVSFLCVPGLTRADRGGVGELDLACTERWAGLLRDEKEKRWP